MANTSLNMSASHRSIMITNTLESIEDGESSDEERKQRKDNVKMQKRLSIVNTRPNQSIELSNSVIQEHITSALSMHNENKINFKNAWKIDIIDLMQKIIKSKDIKESLPLCASSLDVSTKVYSVRLDDVHTEVQKMASSINRKQAQNAGSENDDTQVEECQKKGKKRRRKFVRGQKNTIVKDRNSIIGSFPLLDSTRYQSKNKEDNSGTELFTLSLHRNYADTQFLFCHLQKFDYEDPLVDLTAKYSYPIKKAPIEICPMLKKFKLDNWSLNEDYDIVENNTFVEKQVTCDESGRPIPELDGSLINDFDEPAADEDEFGEFPAMDDLQNAEIKNISDYPLHKTTSSSEYSYYNLSNGNKFVSLVWAGPSHWKQKHIRRNVARFSGVTVKQAPKPKTRKKSVLLLDMDNTDNIQPFIDRDVYKRKRNNRKANANSLVLPLRWAKNDGPIVKLLGCDIVYGYKELEDLAKPCTEEEIEAAPYNYDNANDSMYCAQGDIPCTQQYEETPVESGQSSFTEKNYEPLLNLQKDNLIDMPEIVEKTDIFYLKTSKKIDMRKLKDIMWKQLETEQHTSFSTMVSKVEGNLPSKMKKNFSNHMAFVALLHLCNEHNLELNNSDSLDNFYISKESHMDL